MPPPPKQIQRHIGLCLLHQSKCRGTQDRASSTKANAEAHRIVPPPPQQIQRHTRSHRYRDAQNHTNRGTQSRVTRLCCRHAAHMQYTHSNCVSTHQFVQPEGSATHLQVHTQANNNNVVHQQRGMSHTAIHREHTYGHITHCSTHSGA